MDRTIGVQGQGTEYESAKKILRAVINKIWALIAVHPFSLKQPERGITELEKVVLFMENNKVPGLNRIQA